MRRSLARAFSQSRKQQRSTEAAPDSTAAAPTPCPSCLFLLRGYSRPSPSPAPDSTSPALYERREAGKGYMVFDRERDSTSPALYEPREVPVSIDLWG